MTTVRRKPVSSLLREAQAFLHNKTEAERIGKIRDESKRFLKKYLLSEEDDVYADEKANRYVDFPDPLTIGEDTYAGIKLQRSVSVSIDEDRAKELLAAKSLINYVMHTVTVEEWDWDELYTLNQMGRISDEELDALLEENITWSVWPVKD